MLLRTLVIGLSLSACAWAQGVRITWIGQSCFLIESDGGTPRVLTDPPVASVGYSLPQEPVDVVTVSHNHTDHNNVAGGRGNPVVVDGRGVTARREETAAGLPFVAIPGFHDNANGAVRGANTIIRWTQSGLKLAHLGDFGQDALTAEQAAELRGLDVIFVPAGGTFTIDAARAAALISELKPRIAILMHFRTALGGPAQLTTVPGVAAAFEAIRYKPAVVTIKPQSLPASLEVWLMEPGAELAALNAASLAEGTPVAPGSLVTLRGQFQGAETAGYSGLPLPRQLGATEVLVAGGAVPLLYVSSGQINFQAPSSLRPEQYLVEVRVAGQRVARGPLTVVDKAPGLFCVVNPDWRLNSPSSPARRGQALIVLGTGQGAVTPSVGDGLAAPVSPLAVTPEEPGVFIEGRRMQILYSGLAPGWAGLWQINALVPPDAPTGRDLSLVVLHGMVSNELRVSIE